jgi:Glutaminyl-tRNA synthetase, non-specific RNA binding region part 2
VRATLKWANVAAAKAEVDAQVEALLGPKTEADLKPAEKKKKAKVGCASEQDASAPLPRNLERAAAGCPGANAAASVAREAFAGSTTTPAWSSCAWMAGVSPHPAATPGARGQGPDPQVATRSSLSPHRKSQVLGVCEAGAVAPVSRSLRPRLR